MKRVRIFPAIAALLAIGGFTACNKEIEREKAVNVTVLGYNVGSTQFEVSIDTVAYGEDILNGNAQVFFSKVYPYFPTQPEATVRIKNKATGDAVISKRIPLSSEQLEFFIPFINLDGSLLEVNPPAPDPDSNKLGFYVYYPASEESLDVYIQNEVTYQGTYLAQNVQPGTWVYVNHMPVAGLDTKVSVESYSKIYFVKAGTFDWAFNNSQNASVVNGFGWFLPYNPDETGKVQPYFIVPGSGSTRVVRLFLDPKGY